MSLWRSSAVAPSCRRLWEDADVLLRVVCIAVPWRVVPRRAESFTTEPTQDHTNRNSRLKVSRYSEKRRMLGYMDIPAIVKALDEQIGTLQQVKSLLSAAASAPATERRAQQAASAVATRKAVPSAKAGGTRTMSAEGRARIAAAQKKRWALKNAASPAKKTAPAKTKVKKSTPGTAAAKKAAKPKSSPAEASASTAE